jgi:predicted DNA-binding transcriptional regulator AlpA
MVTKKARSKLLSSRARSTDAVTPAGRVPSPFSPRLVEAENGERQPAQSFAQNPRPPPPLIEGLPVLLDKKQVCALVQRSYDTVWRLMQKNQFPRGRYLGCKLVWDLREVMDYIDHLPRQKLKGDAPLAREDHDAS